MTIIQRCNPHNWDTPNPGDTDLICLDCGRALSLLKITGVRYREMSILLPISSRLDDLDALDAFRGFLGKGPRVSEFHPKGIEQSLSLAREREKTSNYNEAEAYRRLKEIHHKPGLYCGWKDDNETFLPIVWTPHGEPLPLEPSLARWPLSPFFDWGYDGNSPSQLALAVLLHHTGDEQRSLKHYEDFKLDKVARFIPLWKMRKDYLEGWLIERERR